MFDHAISRVDDSILCANVNSVGGRLDERDAVKCQMDEHFFENISINSELKTEEIKKLQYVLWENKDVFVTESSTECCATLNSSQAKRGIETP